MPGFAFCCRLTLVYCVCSCLPGCRSIEKRAPTQEAVATGRQLARQGISELDAGRCQEGEALLRQAVAAVPSDPEAHRYLAEALWQQGNVSEALQHIESAQALSPSDPEVIVRTGEMRLATGDPARAMECASRAIELDSKRPDAWALRGRGWWLKKEPDLALADLQRALQFSPSAPDLLIDVANLYYQQGQPQRCLTTVHRLLDIHPAGEEPLEAIVLEGKAYLTMGLPIPASERFALVKSRSLPSPDLYCLIAQAESAAGRSQAAIAAAQEAVTLDASHRPSRELLAKLTSGAPAATIR
jgi:predicted Zn-dependent protease